MKFTLKALIDKHSELSHKLKELDDYIHLENERNYGGEQREEPEFRKRFETLEPYSYEPFLKYYATYGEAGFGVYRQSTDELVCAVEDMLERFESESFETYADWREAAEDYLGPDLSENAKDFIKWDEVIKGLKDKTLTDDYHELFDGTVLLFL